MPATDQTRGIRELVVLRREVVTPRMVRVVLGGPGLAGFTSDVPDEHVKLVFPDADGATRPPVLAGDGVTLDWPRPFPPNREYTIRRFDQAASEVWIDFVVHPGGLASDWAQRAGAGDALWVVGPKSSLEVVPAADTLVLLADHTALPAVARWLEELAPGTEAHVGVLVPDAREEQDLLVRPGVSVTWLHLDDPEVAAAGDDVLGQHLDSLDLPPAGTTFLWAAGEAGVLKPIRRWARAHGFARGTCDIAGYWRKERTTAVRTSRR